MLAGVAIEAMAKSQQAEPRRRQAGRSGKPAAGGWDDPASAKPHRPRADAQARADPRQRPERRRSVGRCGDAHGDRQQHPRRAGTGKPAPSGAWNPVPGLPAPPPIAAEDREGLLMLRAMIAAAKADGHVDSEERARIADQLGAAGLTPAGRDAVLAEFDRGTTPEALAREASDPMLAAQLYAAAVAGAASIDGAERAWLDDFARALRLDRAATEAIERRIKGA